MKKFNLLKLSILLMVVFSLILPSAIAMEGEKKEEAPKTNDTNSTREQDSSSSESESTDEEFQDARSEDPANIFDDVLEDLIVERDKRAVQTASENKANEKKENKSEEIKKESKSPEASSKDSNKSQDQKPSAQMSRSEKKLSEFFEDKKDLNLSYQVYYKNFIDSFITDQMSKLKSSKSRDDRNFATYASDLLQKGKVNPEIFINREDEKIEKFWNMLNQTQKDVLNFVMAKYKSERASEQVQRADQVNTTIAPNPTVVTTTSANFADNQIVNQTTNPVVEIRSTPVVLVSQTATLSQLPLGIVKYAVKASIPAPINAPTAQSVMPTNTVDVSGNADNLVDGRPSRRNIIQSGQNNTNNAPVAAGTRQTPAVVMSTLEPISEETLKASFSDLKHTQTLKYLYQNVFYISVLPILDKLELADRDFVKVLLTEAEDNPAILRITSDDQDILAKFWSILNVTQQKVLNFIIDKHLTQNGHIARNNNRNNSATTTTTTTSTTATTVVAQSNRNDNVVDEQTLEAILLEDKNRDWTEVYNLFVNCLTTEQQIKGAEFLTEGANDPSVFEIANHSKVSLIEFVATLSNAQWKCIALAIKNYRAKLERQYS